MFFHSDFEIIISFAIHCAKYPIQHISAIASEESHSQSERRWVTPFSPSCRQRQTGLTMLYRKSNYHMAVSDSYLVKSWGSEGTQSATFSFNKFFAYLSSPHHQKVPKSDFKPSKIIYKFWQVRKVFDDAHDCEGYFEKKWVAQGVCDPHDFNT